MKRDKYIDIVKGICILCVVYVHLNIQSNVFKPFFEFIYNFISQFFLTTFFIISGFYLKDIYDIKKFFKNKIKNCTMSRE